MCGAACDEAEAIAKRCIDDVTSFAPGRLRDDVTIVLLCRGRASPRLTLDRRGRVAVACCRMTDDLAILDATAQAELVRTGQLSPVELVDAAITRIEKLDPELNAVIHPRFDQARDEAAAAALPDGPFRGVPTLFKDLMCTVDGEPVPRGHALPEGERLPADDTDNLVHRFRDAGFVFCGRTNTPELGLMPTTEPAAYGPTHNPWDTSRSPGGSSGGSAVGGRDRHGAGRPRQRRRRLDPHPRELLRSRRPQAVARAHVARAPLRVS